MSVVTTLMKRKKKETEQQAVILYHDLEKIYCNCMFKQSKCSGFSRLCYWIQEQEDEGITQFNRYFQLR